MKVFFVPQAQLELSDAVAYYELQYPGLGARFKREVRTSIQRIIELPDAFPPGQKEVRKAFVRAFPYKILFAVESDHLLIVGVS
ncbi:hypothetical protein SAMN05660860_03012 [Geoalkalibacter ferrihydriticus]|uniref:ParE toxin of type II toxin-antitoxin system, parDE n=1 Tax=Geoalkalibacter ferrihydriticus TaxID=392333 RepID=A0A1G9VEI8_9BACT